MSRTSLRVNGVTHTVDVEDDCPLLYVLRDTLGSNNPRFGCGLGQCGACTVLVDNRAVRSCQVPVRSVSGKAVVTIEGLGTPEKPHAVQQAFIDEQASQCGYCLNGWMMTAKVLLDRAPHPSEQDILTACEGLVCRCGSHTSLLAAVRRAASGVTRSA
jgi:nicotinate dehydrogenase subunit A